MIAFVFSEHLWVQEIFCPDTFLILIQSVYGLQNDIRSHSPTHTPTPETKPPTEDELHRQVGLSVK